MKRTSEEMKAYFNEWLISNLPINIDYLRFDLSTQTKIKKLYEINKKN